MANFPNLTPTTRSFSSGFMPVTKHVSLNGYETRVVTGSQIVQQRLEMSFENLATAAGQQIVDHYMGQDGEAKTFKLQSATSAGWEEMRDKWGQLTWRYAEPVNTTQEVNGRINVSVRLVSVF